MREFIGAFSTFLKVQTAMVAEFYGVIHAMEEAQKIRFTNVWLECDSTWFVLHLLLELMFCGCLIIDGILVLIIVGKSGLGLFIFFMKGKSGLKLLIFYLKGMCVSISWII